VIGRRSGRDRKRLVTPVFAAITGAGLAYFMAVGTLVPAVPRYVEQELGGGSLAVGMSVGAFFVAAAVLRPFVGALGDRVGSRWLIVGGASAMALSLTAYPHAGSVELFVLVRSISGIGEAAVFVGASAAINELAPADRRGEALSYWSVAVYGGIGLGPLLGESLIGQGYSWVWAAAAGLCVGTIVLGSFAPHGMRTDQRFRMKQLLHPAGILPGSVLGLGLLGYAGFLAFVPLYTIELGMDGAGRLFFLYAALVLGIRMTAPWLVDRLGAHRAATIALCITGAGLVTIALLRSIVGLYLGTGIMAVGMSMAFPALLTIAVEWAPIDQRRVVIGTFTGFFDLAQGFGAAFLGLFVIYLGYAGALGVGGVAAFAAVGLLVGMRALVGATNPTPPIHTDPIQKGPAT
jgi:MFS family permease